MARRHQAHAAANLARAVHSASRPGSPSLFQRLRAIPRMIRAVRAGQYTGVSTTQLALLGAGVGYILSPIDLVPEGLFLVLGLVDDAMVLSWVALTLVRETEHFIEWEQSMAYAGQAGTGTPPQGAYAHARATDGQTQAQQGPTVPSFVVPD